MREGPMIGLDTGFFVELLKGNEVAVSTWRSLVEDQEQAVVSCLSLFELERLGLKGAIEQADLLQEAIPAVCRVEWLVDMDVIGRGARVSHGVGIPAMDSLILASMEVHEVTSIYSTDAHFERYRRRGVEVIRL
jgi:predicted nucleic acid-binding protein